MITVAPPFVSGRDTSVVSLKTVQSNILPVSHPPSHHAAWLAFAQSLSISLGFRGRVSCFSFQRTFSLNHDSNLNLSLGYVNTKAT